MSPIPPPPTRLVELMEQVDFAPQRPFKFKRANWLKDLQHVPGADDAINSLPDYVDRAIIRQAVAELEEDNVVGAFIAVMIWGYGLTGYGPHRTLRVLSDDFRHGAQLSSDVVTKLRGSITVAREQGTIAGYSYLNNDGKMRGLAASFFTKWLYYITATGPQDEAKAAPILDNIVINWFRGEVGEKLRRDRTPYYERYVEILVEWGTPYDLSAVDVEERIFRILRDDGVV